MFRIKDTIYTIPSNDVLVLPLAPAVLLGSSPSPNEALCGCKLNAPVKPRSKFDIKLSDLKLYHYIILINSVKEDFSSTVLIGKIRAFRFVL